MEHFSAIGSRRLLFCGLTQLTTGISMQEPAIIELPSADISSVTDMISELEAVFKGGSVWR